MEIWIDVRTALETMGCLERVKGDAEVKRISTAFIVVLSFCCVFSRAQDYYVAEVSGKPR